MADEETTIYTMGIKNGVYEVLVMGVRWRSHDVCTLDGIVSRIQKTKGVTGLVHQ